MRELPFMLNMAMPMVAAITILAMGSSSWYRSATHDACTRSSLVALLMSDTRYDVLARGIAAVPIMLSRMRFRGGDAVKLDAQVGVRATG